jgi:hypothetical protein
MTEVKVDDCTKGSDREREDDGFGLDGMRDSTMARAEAGSLLAKWAPMRAFRT